MGERKNASFCSLSSRSHLYSFLSVCKYLFSTSLRKEKESTVLPFASSSSQLEKSRCWHTYTLFKAGHKYPHKIPHSVYAKRSRSTHIFIPKLFTPHSLVDLMSFTKCYVSRGNEDYRVSLKLKCHLFVVPGTTTSETVKCMCTLEVQHEGCRAP